MQTPRCRVLRCPLFAGVRNHVDTGATPLVHDVNRVLDTSQRRLIVMRMDMRNLAALARCEVSPAATHDEGAPCSATYQPRAG